MLEIQNKVAVVTGGANGIGRTIVNQWVKLGGKAVIGDFDVASMEKAKAELGSAVEICQIDVTKEADTERLARTAIEAFGQINLVVPSAGIIRDQMTVSPDRNDPSKVIKMPLDTWQRVIDVNLTGVFLTVRDCLEQMVIHKCTGAVVVISSTGSMGTAGQLNYSSTKAAMSIFPKVLTGELMRRKLSQFIRVNAVAPGYTETPMTASMNQDALEKICQDIPIGRMTTPEEVASVIFEMYRNEAISGEVYFVHGGLRLSSRG
jgi:3-oxoacyl-[acyl-carrier protein] reductase